MEEASLAELMSQPEVRGRLREGREAHNAVSRASSWRIARALLVADPPSIQTGEITDKGYVNQRAVLDRRAALVERLYGEASDEVIEPSPPAPLPTPSPSLTGRGEKG